MTQDPTPHYGQDTAEATSADRYGVSKDQDSKFTKARQEEASPEMAEEACPDCGQSFQAETEEDAQGALQDHLDNAHGQEDTEEGQE